MFDREKLNICLQVLPMCSSPRWEKKRDVSLLSYSCYQLNMGCSLMTYVICCFRRLPVFLAHSRWHEETFSTKWQIGLLAMWKESNAYYKWVYPRLKNPHICANLGVKVVLVWLEAHHIWTFGQIGQIKTTAEPGIKVTLKSRPDWTSFRADLR